MGDVDDLYREAVAALVRHDAPINDDTILERLLTYSQSHLNSDTHCGVWRRWMEDVLAGYERYDDQKRAFLLRLLAVFHSTHGEPWLLQLLPKLPFPLLSARNKLAFIEALLVSSERAGELLDTAALATAYRGGSLYLKKAIARLADQCLNCPTLGTFGSQLVSSIAGGLNARGRADLLCLLDHQTNCAAKLALKSAVLADLSASKDALPALPKLLSRNIQLVGEIDLEDLLTKWPDNPYVISTLPFFYTQKPALRSYIVEALVGKFDNQSALVSNTATNSSNTATNSIVDILKGGLSIADRDRATISQLCFPLTERLFENQVKLVAASPDITVPDTALPILCNAAHYAVELADSSSFSRLASTVLRLSSKETLPQIWESLGHIRGYQKVKMFTGGFDFSNSSDLKSMLMLAMKDPNWEIRDASMAVLIEIASCYNVSELGITKGLLEVVEVALPDNNVYVVASVLKLLGILAEQGVGLEVGGGGGGAELLLERASHMTDDLVHSALITCIQHGGDMAVRGMVSEQMLLRTIDSDLCCCGTKVRAVGLIWELFPITARGTLSCLAEASQLEQALKSAISRLLSPPEGKGESEEVAADDGTQAAICQLLQAVIDEAGGGDGSAPSMDCY